MKIIIGLGNPGEKYKETWHNIGFLAVDDFVKKNNFPDFSLSKKFNMEISEGKINDKNIILGKPRTYMNESGKAVGPLKNFYKATGKDIIIIHDDIDLLLGKIKISQDRGSAGHKGVQSIFDKTGIQEFIRIRIGINSDFEKSRKAKDFVLKKISRNEKHLMKKSIDMASKAIETLVKEGIEKAMNQYNS